jgi:hypothetical protein
MKSTIAELFQDNYEAKCVYKLLADAKQSVFLTGKAGTGKSKFIQWAKEISKTHCMVLAPTGFAAFNIDGRTIHSVFRIPTDDLKRVYDNLYLHEHFNEEKRKIFRQTDLIIIDEISMVTAEIMDCMDYILKQICFCDKPFAGKTVLLVGDLFQLPPITKSKAGQKSQSQYFYESNVYKKLKPYKIQLQKNYRQQDKDFCSLLDNIRDGVNLFRSVEEINKRCFEDTQQKEVILNAMVLTYTTAAAASINKMRFAELPGEEIEFTKEVWKEGGYMKDPKAERIVLKKGARVIINKNDPHGRYANGTCGFVKSYDEKTVTIEDNNGNEIRVSRKVEIEEKLSYYGKKKNHKRFERNIKSRQFPIELGWAMTVHRSQGLTFDNIELANYGSAYCSGQVYVALSRCKSLEGIRLHKPLIHLEVYHDNKVRQFCSNMTKWEDVNSRIEEIDDWEILKRLPTQFDRKLVYDVVNKDQEQISDLWVDDFLTRTLNCNWVKARTNHLYERVA